jgi:hypothetical protein
VLLSELWRFSGGGADDDEVFGEVRTCFSWDQGKSNGKVNPAYENLEGHSISVGNSRKGKHCKRHLLNSSDNSWVRQDSFTR